MFLNSMAENHITGTGVARHFKSGLPRVIVVNTRMIE